MERRTAARPIRYPSSTPVEFGETRHQGQSDAHTRSMARLGGALTERLEDGLVQRPPDKEDASDELIEAEEETSSGNIAPRNRTLT